MGTPRIDRIEKNFIINGDFRYWLRATSATATTEAYRTADRWNVGRAAGTMDAVVSRSTDVPSAEFDYSMNVAVNTVQASLSAGHRFGIFQPIEGLFAKPLYNKKAYLRFWAKTNRPGTYGIWSGNSPATHSWNSSYSVGVADTWEKKSIAIDFSTKLGTWKTDNGLGAYIYFTLAGADQTSNLNQWISGAGYVPTGQQNLFASAGGYFRIAGVHLVIVDTIDDAEEFPFRDIITEGILCKRYYDEFSAYAPNNGLASGSQSGLGGGQFPVEKRAAPALSVYYDGTKALLNIVRNDNTGGQNTITSAGGGTREWAIRASGLTAGHQYSYYLVQDAEL